MKTEPGQSQESVLAIAFALSTGVEIDADLAIAVLMVNILDQSVTDGFTFFVLDDEYDMGAGLDIVIVPDPLSGFINGQSGKMAVNQLGMIAPVTQLFHIAVFHGTENNPGSFNHKNILYINAGSNESTV